MISLQKNPARRVNRSDVELTISFHEVDIALTLAIANATKSLRLLHPFAYYLCIFEVHRDKLSQPSEVKIQVAIARRYTSSASHSILPNFVTLRSLSPSFNLQRFNIGDRAHRHDAVRVDLREGLGSTEV